MDSAATSTSTRAPALEALRVNVIIGRARSRLSQTELAERAGVSRPTISRIERASGDVGIDVIQRIADALGVAVADLFISANAVSVDEDELLGDRSIERYSQAGRPPMAR